MDADGSNVVLCRQNPNGHRTATGLRPVSQDTQLFGDCCRFH
jgi:hypothetical protein